ncbi:hypothetical protein TWF730_003480 [Orbilia blumenaviensis]|uniref:NB-ARC domain-containing protein n=1 Tax=Orbilia blumenaviensis TaxID=1796055 RepID=A0AAV9U5N7_9PEZI
MATELRTSDYSVGWICAIPIELAAALSILDETHPQLEVTDGDTNVYKFGRIGRHNVVISWLPEGRYGITRAGIVAAHMRSTFQRLRFGLMVGVGGGAPSESNDIRLGDIVISQPTGVSGGVVQYDFGKAMENGEFLLAGSLNAPPSILLKAVASIKAESQAELGRKISNAAEMIEEKDPRFQYPGQDTDRLFRADYNHVTGTGRQSDTCKSCDPSKVVPRPDREHDHPYLHYGIIASANQVMKDGIKRDKITAQTGALCFEMEAAGLMDDFPCIVVRGVCDYSDGHKNKRWQPYAALVAAAYAKELLLQIPAVSRDETRDPDAKREKIRNINLVIPFRLPFPRNSTFVGRAQELRQAYEFFSESNITEAPRLFALVGTGGIGKTQVALEYAYRHRRDYTSIFWVSAASEHGICTSFIDIIQRIVKEQARISWPESPPDYQAIASKLGIPGLIDSKGRVSADLEAVDEIRSALFNWLQLPGKNRWLLIFDNVDDLETFNIEEYLPNQGNGAIFITSRRPEFSQGAKQVSLDGLDSKSAVTLLLNLAHLTVTPGDSQSETTEAEALTLVKKLGFMPLAINHAGCYINATKVPLEEYLSYYDKAFMTVQSKKPKFGWNYRNDTAATTWEISYSRVEEQDKEAASLLLVCSYLNPEEIFETLWEDEMIDKFEIKNKILLLGSYSLLSIMRFGVFSVHPVVHTWARERPNPTGPFKTINSAITILGKASKHENVSRGSNKWDAREERRIAAHLQYLNQYTTPIFPIFLQEEQGFENRVLYHHIHSIALVFNNQNRYGEAMQWYERALVGCEKTLGENHPDTLSTINNIAGVFDNQGKFTEAVQWYERALAGRKETLGENHTDTLTTINNMAGVFDNQGKYNEAVELYEQALAGREKVLGEDHSSTLSTINNIALVFSNQGQYDKAVQWYERAFAGKEKALGRDHPDTLIMVNNIAAAFENQGKYDKAVEWYQRALIGKERTLGEDHLSTLTTVNNIAGVFFKQGKYDEAMEWYERAYSGTKATLGEDHLSTVTMMNNIAFVLRKQDKYDDAVDWYKRALAGCEALGEDHPTTLTTISNIAGVFKTQGKYDEAMRWYERALSGQEDSPGLGEDHPSTLVTVNNIAGLLFEQGKYDEAMQWYERALAGKERAPGLGKDHPSTLATVNNIAGVFLKQCKYYEAMQWYQRALAGFKALGEDHPSTLTTIHSIALISINQGKDDDAIEWYKQALTNSKAVLGEDHASILAMIKDIALMFKTQKKYDRVIQWYEYALASKEQALGENYAATFTTINNIASVFKNGGNIGKLIQWYEYALLTSWEKAQGEDSTST